MFCFLEQVGWNFGLQPSESPDYLALTPYETFGLEVTRLFKDDHGSGSPRKQREEKRGEYLRTLASTYYAMGGKPLSLTANLRNWPLDPKLIPHIARRLIRHRPSLEERFATLEVKTRRAAANFHLLGLRDGMGEYRIWQCTDNSVGMAWSTDENTLLRLISKKAEKLPQYRKRVQETMLLIVADYMWDSGRYRHTPMTTLLPSYGFSQVYLLAYPFESWRIA
ncbi:MAG TPA: hypothetical protein VNO22_01790 [Planctomycetota bacterium]|nr:hypothetical protein [Planctomycetota bacterium]